MKHLAHTLIALTTLILLLFGAGGVALMKCACSGKTSLVMPLDEGCCRTERECMTITVLHLSDYDTDATFHSPLPTLHFPLSTFHSPLSTPHSPLPTLHSPLSTPHTSPPPAERSMVMRV